MAAAIIVPLLPAGKSTAPQETAGVSCRAIALYSMRKQPTGAASHAITEAYPLRRRPQRHVRQLTHVLGQEGYKAQSAGTSTEALLLARAANFDLYVIDSRLPDGDGYELCRALRVLHLTTPVIIYSADTYPADHAKSCAAGAHIQIDKPHIERLIATVFALLI